MSTNSWTFDTIDPGGFNVGRDRLQWTKFVGRDVKYNLKQIKRRRGGGGWCGWRETV